MNPKRDIKTIENIWSKQFKKVLTLVLLFQKLVGVFVIYCLCLIDWLIDWCLTPTLAVFQLIVTWTNVTFEWYSPNILCVLKWRILLSFLFKWYCIRYLFLFSIIFSVVCCFESEYLNSHLIFSPVCLVSHSFKF